MKRIFVVLNVLFFCYSVSGQSPSSKNTIRIIPEPVSVQALPGFFELNAKTVIDCEKSSSLRNVADLFIDQLKKSTGFNLRIDNNISGKRNNQIHLKLNSEYDSLLGDEGYRLSISAKQVDVAANQPAGIFYGLQTFKQLLPANVESDIVIKDVHWATPCTNIIDYPKFHWRGMMLDVSRQFFTKKEVENYINQLAKYKYNIFHWHLTDDQGWRIEIKGLPELTEVGAWRVPRSGSWRVQGEIKKNEKPTYGGFYTQQEIREVIDYAKKRFINILPEIDVPGHSLALIASYPNLSCTQIPYPVYPKNVPDSIDNDLCVANDSTWMILDKIFTQIAQLFPFEYIHVGGDEAGRKFWIKHDLDRELMEKAGLKTPEELQSYFEKRLERIIISKGKKMMGWDEILEGGLAPEAAVMSWRGIDGGIKASQMSHQVIMNVYGKTYFSQLQGDPLIEPEGPAMTRLKTTYSTEILPPGIDPKWVLGGEASLWTEFIPNFRHLEYMTWPRALAAAEVFWGTKTNWDDFVGRVEANLPRLNAAKVKYAPSMFDPVISAVKKNDSLKVVLDTEIPGLDIYYTFDGTDPDSFYPEYNGYPLSIPAEASEIRVVTYKNGKQIGRQINCPVSALKKRVVHQGIIPE